MWGGCECLKGAREGHGLGRRGAVGTFVGEGKRGSRIRKTERGRRLLKDWKSQSCGFWLNPEQQRVVTVWVGRGFNGVQKFHVADVVEVYLIFKDHDKAFTVEANC